MCALQQKDTLHKMQNWNTKTIDTCRVAVVSEAVACRGGLQRSAAAPTVCRPPPPLPHPHPPSWYARRFDTLSAPPAAARTPRLRLRLPCLQRRLHRRVQSTIGPPPAAAPPACRRRTRLFSPNAVLSRRFRASTRARIRPSPPPRTPPLPSSAPPPPRTAAPSPPPPPPPASSSAHGGPLLFRAACHSCAVSPPLLNASATSIVACTATVAPTCSSADVLRPTERCAAWGGGGVEGSWGGGGER